MLRRRTIDHSVRRAKWANGRTPHELMSGPGGRAAVPANVAKGSLIRRGFTANACLLRGSGTVNARRTRSPAHAPAASNCCRSSTGPFRGYDPGGATAFEIYVTETKNWSGFRIFWGYKQVAWAIHPSSDSRWTYLPQAHNPGIICIERSKKLRKVRLSDGCSSSNVRALRYGSLKEYRGRCSFWPLWGLRAPSHSLESVQFFLLPMISAARLRSFLAPPSRPTYAVFEVRAR